MLVQQQYCIRSVANVSKRTHGNRKDHNGGKIHFDEFFENVTVSLYYEYEPGGEVVGEEEKGIKQCFCVETRNATVHKSVFPKYPKVRPNTSGNVLGN